MKTIPALIAAFGITAVVAVAMLLIGANALFNPNAVQILNSPNKAAAASVVDAASSTTSTVNTSAIAQQNAQLHALVKQYQDREKQYQTELNQAAQQVTQANQAASQASQAAQGYQNILAQLQQMGVIRITNDGRIQVNAFNTGSSNNTSTSTNFSTGDD